jgi:superfamily II DNA or RNA helicase
MSPTERDYQRDLRLGIQGAWDNGAQNVMGVAPTGSGKTVIMSRILADHDGPSVAIAHRGELVSQISLALARNDVRHNIVGPSSLIRQCVREHHEELGRSWYSQRAECAVASVQSLKDVGKPTLWVQDEAHHTLRDNQWGRAVSGLKGARGLGLTATPVRADGRGLGRAWDGLMDEMIVGPSMRDLILAGHLTRYRVMVPPNDLDLSAVATGSTGDYVQPQLRAAVARSSITGDVVRDYLRFAPGKRGVTFVTDVDTAGHVAALYRAAGVPAEAVSAKTPAALRADLVRRLRDGRLLQLVNVDLFGEGFDLPAIECVSMLRPSESFPLVCQQFGRALRLMEGKTRATIIDHVGNVQRHGLPDSPREWSLERREKKAKSVASAIPLRVCPECSGAYEGYSSECPYCGHVRLPALRTAPEHVEGDLIELNWEALEALRGAVAHVDGPARIPWGATPVVEGAVRKRHRERQESQTVLREAIAVWAGHQRAAGRPDSESYRRFWHAFGIDVMSAQALGAREAETLAGKVLNALCQ